jgi:hypothetical protein
MSLAIAAI